MPIINGTRILILYFLNLSLLLSGQIFSPSADNSRATGPGYQGNDSIFIFFSTPASLKKGSLTAIPPLSGLWNFEWFRYNPALNGFDPPFMVHSNLAQSTAGNLDDGGYRVRMTNGMGSDTTFTAWVFINELRVEVEKTNQGMVKPGKFTCDFLIINGKVLPDTFIYYDPGSHQILSLSSDYTFLWTSDNPDLIIPNADRILDPNITYQPPYINTRYFLTATDGFGMKASDDVLYESIQVKADFDFMFFDKDDSKTYIEAPEPNEGGAPLDVKFTNRSINGSRFEWIFSDTVRSGFFSNEVSTDLYYEPEFTYEIPDDYFPALISISAQGCTDSFSIEQPITVLPSLLEIPNVFSPDGDDINRYFKVKHRSIREFSIVIMNRWGRVVYRADVRDLYDWEGWDGTVLNTNNPAPPGAYFYVIEAWGYDSKRYYRNQYKGTVYLFRGEY